jgi:hypothetical protein
LIKSRVFIVAALLFAVCAGTHAQEHGARQRATPPAKSSSVRLGNQTVVIPIPDGFEEATSQFEAYKQRMVTTEAPQNDMLLSHMPVSDCDLMRNGSDPTYNFYTKVSVLRIAREMVITREMLTTAAEGYRKNAGAFLDPNGAEMQRLQKRLSQGISELDSRETTIDLSKPQQLGEIDSRPDVHAFLTMITVNTRIGDGAQVSIPMLSTTSFVRVKQRIIFVYAFTKYRTAADIETIKQFARKWNTSILAANVSQ